MASIRRRAPVDLGPIRTQVSSLSLRRSARFTAVGRIWGPFSLPHLYRYFGRSPDKLTLDDVHAFQVHLVSSGISWPGLNQIVCALRFFYGVTLGEAAVPERIPYAREPRKLPIVLSADEVVRFLEAVWSFKAAPR